uniref:Uncharacterized protein n=1 Tax=Arion vulgaris TaxID=1028688 RepID=A0A0B7C3Z7_9EUPU
MTQNAWNVTQKIYNDAKSNIPAWYYLFESAQQQLQFPATFNRVNFSCTSSCS